MRQAGFTLIELLVALTVIGILAGVGVPAFGEMIAAQRRFDAAQQLASGIRAARVEAIMRNKFVVIRAINGNWSKGWQIVVDPKNTEDDLILVDKARQPTVTIIGNRPVRRHIRFDGLGAPVANGFQAGSIFICDPKEAGRHLRVVLGKTGRVAIENAEQDEPFCRSRA